MHRHHLHEDISTTMIYLHCLNDPEKKVVSPLDRLNERNAEQSEVQASVPERMAMPEGDLRTPESDLEGVPSNEFSSICRCLRSLMG
ncbi:hypothetical protein [Stieleria varia]|uniref:Uncharacterized protein n=1 Tax=Stieleria varia TaxID=2528005 RepID=A0A5C6B2X1_9BACT|nr:hypothetical protein [Stieleria varia]TWU05842.1 hypothetical protein Pla52n_15570 [Stieleria varia]